MNELINFSAHEVEEWLVLNNVANKELYLISLLLLFAFLVVLLAKKYRIPIVVGYVFLGILLSPDIISIFPVIDSETVNMYTFVLSNLDYVTNIALAFIAFTIGSELSIKTLKRLGKSIFSIAIMESVLAFVVVTTALYFIGRPLYMALLFGAIASATAPAATVMVLKEYNAEGPLTSTIMAVVGLDDAFALIIFSLINPIAYSQYRGEGAIKLSEIIVSPLIEIFGAIILGLFFGYITQYLLTKFNEKTRKILTIVTSITLSSAVSIFFGLSALIANMSVGFAVRNFAKKNLEISEEMDTLTVPLYAMFFIIAGTEIRFSEMGSLSFLLIAFTYLIARIIGKVGGSTLAARISGAPEAVQKFIGFGLLPQSGVAIALAYSVQKQYVQDTKVGLLIFNTLLLTAAMTEVFGPLLTKYAVIQSGEGKID
ncbi:cation:proton antiporter [Halanaerobium congolense]|jgi:Kef-type K+ transport system membrane component KefB|uniref:Kef-type K+ transport system, membrane component KefB n=1 Tax=Halanaerobium congolense TaxID=54121 RepID=A0A1G6J4S5_9FIRM|nr:cation:proton antiporter [Halanaerobium congolense]PUU93298.1 MAG: sodium/hydrogen exchanger [Halanaerobium sp.]PXV70051.1 transporter (CPA2 family) [Halanaerobium congolense]SDC13285.1 Kef-type K+ transport system, membrane component KefB [Halanaerobium congolense]SDI43280.1 Kef-type K+ transport system, membrane component KefB [Halanaerobium congolense]SDK57575.1 Kef-type K+ transport system, membrane component KefB [Halanaerobium congolense]